MKIKKAIIPAAGMGTRFLPATKSQPKEMLPIVDKPCIQYLVEEAVNSGIKQIIIITGRGKRSIEDHFDHSFELDSHLRNKQKNEAVKEMKRIEKLAKIYYVRQPRPQGDGHAILCAKDLLDDEPVAVLFGDDIYDSKVPPLKQMIEKYEKYQSPIVALQEVPKEECDKYGIISGQQEKDGTYKVDNLIEKPSIKKAPSNLAITGKYIITPELLKMLEKAPKTKKDGELRLINGMQEYIKHFPIYGHIVKGQRFDTGDKLGYLKATVHFALKHKDLKKDFQNYLKTVI